MTVFDGPKALYDYAKQNAIDAYHHPMDAIEIAMLGGLGGAGAAPLVYKDLKGKPKKKKEEEKDKNPIEPLKKLIGMLPWIVVGGFALFAVGFMVL